MILAPSRSIWTPRDPSRSRLSPWWNYRRKLQSVMEWFSAGGTQRNPLSGGHKRKKSTGGTKRNSDSDSSCCCSACSCPGAAPSSWTATLSGVTMCTCTQVLFHTFYSSGSGNPNGTFTTTYFANRGTQGCLWIACLLGNATAGIYSDSSCTSLLRAFPYAYLAVQLLSDGIFAEFVLSSTNDFCSEAFSGSLASAFESSATGYTDCTASKTMANGDVTCGGSSPDGIPTVGTGGNITLSPNP